MLKIHSGLQPSSNFLRKINEKRFFTKEYAKNNDSCKDHFKVHMSWAGGRGGTVFSLYFCFNLKISQILLNNPNIYNLAITLF